MKMIGNVSDWLSYAGGALIKVADSAGSTVFECPMRIFEYQFRHSLTSLVPIYSWGKSDKL